MSASWALSFEVEKYSIGVFWTPAIVRLTLKIMPPYFRKENLGRHSGLISGGIRMKRRFQGKIVRRHRQGGIAADK
jgi:hypothetical protein